MTGFVQRSPHASGGAPIPAAARNAALLIDFDNITLGVRSDLGKELRTLLNSEIFSGKVAVRRAYADWRRYPNYVVPLTEASVDLIFAPAYGTSKKNATDLRMAVDAIELAFMRPELGTFILLTGDSDFTSCVVKLKEYGKYVIGVGMRDSSSDLLIQNCDEYYSYHALSGLVREGDQGGVRKDPWLLVREAVQKMAGAGDSMRTDRLKQVMIDLDPNFDEKDEGYSKFSKFVQVAAEKGLIRLHKVENGQFEVAPADEAAALPEPRYREDRDRERDRSRGRDRGRGRGRDRDRDRGPREYAPAAERPEREEPAAEAAPVRLHRDEEAPASVAAAEVAPYEPAGAPLVEEPAAPPATQEERDARQHSYALLQHAVRALVSRQGQTARDGDVKRRMLDMDPGFNEGDLGFSKFSRFLRQAHEDQVVDVRRLAEGRYEVALPASGTKLAPPSLAAGPRPQPINVDREVEAADRAAAEAPAERRDRGRGRGRGRGGAEGAPAILPGQLAGPAPEPTPAAEPQPTAETAQPAAETPRPEPRREPAPEPRQPEAATPPPAPPTPPAAPSAAPSAGGEPRGMGHRGRGRRPAWASPSGPPPLLPGQVIHIPGSVRPAETQDLQPEPRAEAPSTPEPQPVVESQPADEQRPSRRDRGRGRDRERTPAAEAPQPAAPAFDPAALGLPSDRAGIEAHLAGYRGVGAATVRSLVERFGDGVFQALEEDPDGIRTLLGRRAGPLLETWAADRDARRAERQPAVEERAEAAREFAEATSAVAPEPEQPSAEAEPPAAQSEAEGFADEGDSAPEAEEHRSRRRGRRGGRNRHRRSAEGEPTGADEAEATAAPAPEAAPEVTLADVSPRAAAEEASVEEAAAIDQPSRRGRRGGPGRSRRETPAAETIDVGGVELPVGDRGETDPTLMEQAARPAGEPQPRGRSRGRGGRGRGGAETPSAGSQPAAETTSADGADHPVAASSGETDPTLAESATRPDGEAQSRGRSRSRGGRGRGGRAEAPSEPQPTPAPATAEAAAPADQQPRGRNRGRGGRTQEAATPTPPATEAQLQGTRGGRGNRAGGAATPPPAQPTPTADGGRSRGGRGRGGAQPAAEAPAPAPEAPAAEGGSRPRRNRGRGGRGRGGNAAS